jgi:hypothetical protein
MNRDMRTGIETFGPDFGAFPSDCWGRRDWALVEGRYQPLGKMPLAPAPTRSLQGFRIFPGQRAPLTKGERAVREIRASGLGSRR